MTSKQCAALVSLGAVWGGSFLFIRFTVGTFGPFLLMVIRVSVAGILLVIYARATGQLQLPLFRQHWRSFLTIGALNSAIPYSLIGFSQLHITASLGSILNSTTALFTALLAAIWLRERLRRRKVMGFIVGVAGVVVLVGWSPLPLTWPVLAATAAALASTVSYAAAGIFSARHFRNIPALSVAIGQQFGAAVLLLPLGMASAPHRLHPSPTVVLAVLGLASLSTAFAYILYFYLIDQVGPTMTLSVTYLIPVFGMIWGVTFLHETITPGVVLGLAMILFSVIWVNQLFVPARWITWLQARVPSRAVLAGQSLAKRGQPPGSGSPRDDYVI